MNLDLRHAVNETDRCECGNCDWKGTVAEVSEITDAEQRLTPGDPLPIGDCPKCRALAYLSFADKADYCKACKVEHHDICGGSAGLDVNCPCCKNTIEQIP